MQLLYAPTSPFVRKVMVCAHLTDQIEQIQLLDSAANPIKRDARIATHNPLAKVPTLILDNGQALYDSRVICKYLASLTGDTRLYPVDSSKQWQALMRQELGNGLLDAALLARYELTARPIEKQWPAWREAQLTKVAACLKDIEAQAPTLPVDAPTIGEVTLGCALGYLDFRFPEIDWRADHPQAASWNEAFQKLPAMLATVPRES
ncbi:glutathione S-transferase [Bordetella muralis]|uniref:glutathione S-transferase n=1 Tax=Bordetella muralis TaxID=1649130 RepID=UPI0039EFFE4D